MAVLSGRQIRERLESGDRKLRIVVCPLLEPDEQVRSDQASVDLRLGFDFAFVTPSSYGSVDELNVPRRGSGRALFGDLFRRHFVPFGQKLVIHPHQFILAATLEYIRLPQDVMAYVIGRSTWGRLGLIVATAVGIQPGFAGTLTLELRNLGEAPLSLSPGHAIAQLFFHTIEDDQLAGLGLGQYSGAVDILPRALSSDRTRAKLAALAQPAQKS